MDRKIGQPEPTGQSAAEIEKEEWEQHDSDHIDENTLLSSRMYRNFDRAYRSIREITGDFEIRKMVDRQARHLRGDYIVNTRMERYMQPGSHPNSDPKESSKNFPLPGNIEDQHLIRPVVSRGRRGR